MSYTHLCLLIDRSGSMSNIQQEMESSLTAMLVEQSKLPHRCTFSVYQFDSQPNCPVLECLHSFVSINSNRNIKIQPRGMTPLYDATCQCIDLEGRKLSELSTDNRPDRVVFVIITDGLENASQEFKAVDVKTRIKHQETKYSWQFLYLGSNQIAEDTAKNIGIYASNALTYNNPITMSKSLNTHLSNVRCCSLDEYTGYTNGDLESFSDEDKKEQQEKNVVNQ